MSSKEQPLIEMFSHIDPSLVSGVLAKFGDDLDSAAAYLIGADASEIPAFLGEEGDDGREEEEEQGVEEMVSMGFDRSLCELMLEHHGGDVRKATEAVLDGHIPEQVKAMLLMAKMDGAATSLVADPVGLLAALQQHDALVRGMVDSEAVFLTAAPPLPPSVLDAAILASDEMLARFIQKPFLAKYNGGPREIQQIQGLKAGEPVPQYFANASQGSMYHRKVLSMAGLRNLLRDGPTIYGELQTRKFSGEIKPYGKGGLAKMRVLTGNTVDLDTVVLRCSEKAVLEMVNKMNAATKEHPQYGSGDEFGASPQAREMAVSMAAPYLEGFAAAFKLTTEAQQKERKIHVSGMSKDEVPVASDNNQRGMWPVWQYINCGVNTFHVNVPYMPDVVGALLRAPVAAVIGYLQSRDVPHQLAAFYEEGIADTCFNAKWKSIEEYNNGFVRKQRIGYVLAEVQKVHQTEFRALYARPTEPTQEEEASLLLRLLEGRAATDGKGKVRPITRADAMAWIVNPAADI